MSTLGAINCKRGLPPETRSFGAKKGGLNLFFAINCKSRRGTVVRTFLCARTKQLDSLRWSLTAPNRLALNIDG
jgi:hypothetical protein